MLLPDRGEPGDGVTPGLIAPLNPRLPSVRDGEPPTPVRTQKYVPPPLADSPGLDHPAAWMRIALFLVWFVFVLVQEPSLWVVALLYLVIWAIPGKVLKRLIPAPLRRDPTLIQGDSGDTWITHVPSILVEDASRNTVRLPFRVLSALIALASMLLAMEMDDQASLFVRITFFLCGMVFGGVALVPDGDLRRMVPRFSSHARLPAPGDDTDAG